MAMTKKTAAAAVGPPITSLCDRIASCALRHYSETLPGNKGKPKPNEEWTVYAAIVAHQHNHSEQNSQMWVVSCATGTKCTTTQRHDGCILRDTHAEILARRGLLRVLWAEVIQNQQQHSIKTISPPKMDKNNNSNHKYPPLLVESSSPSLLSDKESAVVVTTSKCYRLNPTIRLHLYISDSPCGDAAIYEIPSIKNSEQEEQPSLQHNSIQYTGAKIIVSQATGVNPDDCGASHQQLLLPYNAGAISNTTSRRIHLLEGLTTTAVVAREETQMLGKLRTKAGRSNLPDHLRSSSMSCSDKIALWGVLGIQGALLSRFVDTIILTSIVVSRDPRIVPDTDRLSASVATNSQHMALQRAITRRIQHARDVLNATCQGDFAMGCSKSSQRPTPTVHVVSQAFASGKASMSAIVETCHEQTEHHRKYKRKYDNTHSEMKEDATILYLVDESPPLKSHTKISPCGVAFNWNQMDDTLELLVGARGIQHGKKPKTNQDYHSLASRLCALAFSRAAILAVSPNQDSQGCGFPKTAMSYQQLKLTMGCRYGRENKTILLTDKKSPFVGWIQNGGVHDFQIRM